MKEIKLPALLNLSFAPLLRWWWRQVEQHALICAEVEQKREIEARANVAYYQKQATIARSNQLQ